MNFKNRTIFNRDNLEILKGIDSGCIDLIYLDPPFNKKKVFTAPMGSGAEGASFADYFREEDVKDEWVQEIKEDYEGLHDFLNGIKNLQNITAGKNNKHYLYNYCYLCYMSIRLLEMRRILKDTGSIYFHCDNTMGHYIKIMMDIIFGEKNFRSDVVWNGGSVSGFKSQKKGWIRQYDNIFFYTKSNDFIFNKQYLPYKKKYIHKMFNKIDEHGRMYRDRGYKKFYADEGGSPLGHNWTDIYSLQTITRSKQKANYPTQKPLALLERIIRASSNEGDVVLDPFCGCATTCVAAEKLKRKWAGIDVKESAFELVKKRAKKEVLGEEKNGQQSLIDYDKEISFKIDIPKRTDRNGDDEVVKKYLYIISHPLHKGFYKVGIASNYKARLSSYQTADPKRQYKLEYEYLTPYFREIESHLHATFDNLMEWVRASKEEIITEIKSKEKKLISSIQ